MKRLLVAFLLFALPAAVAQWAKRSDWGATKNAPQFRHKGNPKAALTVLEYSDFQCPSCAGIQPTVKKLMEAYPDKFRVVFKYFPLTKIHKHAMEAAVSAECAGLQGRFWEYHDRLFEGQAQWATLTSATTVFAAYASAIPLDIAKFTACQADPQTTAAVKRDMEEAARRKIGSTPTFFIGDTRLVGNYMVSDGARTIEKELRR